MNATGAYDVAAVASNIETFAEPSGRVPNRRSVASEVTVFAASGQNRNRPWQLAMLGNQLRQRVLPGAPVDIEHKDVRCSAGADPVIGLRIVSKVPLEFFLVRRRAMYTAFDRRALLFGKKGQNG